MAVDPLPVWQAAFAALPKVSDSSWALNFATCYHDRIVGIYPDPSAFQPAGWLFLFPTPVFAGLLQVLTPTPSSLAGITAFADAWATTITGITFPALLSASSGSVKPPPAGPPSIFSVVNSVVIDPASVIAGHAKIMELVTSPPVGDALLSQFPVKFREATLLLTVSVTGLDSTPPVPLPLAVTMAPLL